MNENDIIDNYLKKLSINNSSSKFLNDDIFFDKKNKLAVTVDTYNEDVHFLNFDKPNLLIKKVLRSSLSDLICKGINPKYYFISISSPRGILNKKNLKLISNSLINEQKKFNIYISGGDTNYSKKISFTLTCIGFGKKIIERNNVKLNDDIYVTGNIGDSYIGLKILKNKIKYKNNYLKNYFEKKYYEPELAYKFTKILNKYANSSIDVSDGLYDDLNKLINKQKQGYRIYINKIPTSTNFKKILKINKLKLQDHLFHGDDYQILFTAPKKFRNVLISESQLLKQKVTIIGEICSKSTKNFLTNGNSVLNTADFKGYTHIF